VQLPYTSASHLVLCLLLLCFRSPLPPNAVELEEQDDGDGGGSKGRKKVYTNEQKFFARAQVTAIPCDLPELSSVSSHLTSYRSIPSHRIPSYKVLH
jgi:hypothetical protein